MVIESEMTVEDNWNFPIILLIHYFLFLRPYLNMWLSILIATFSLMHTVKGLVKVVRLIVSHLDRADLNWGSVEETRDQFFEKKHTAKFLFIPTPRRCSLRRENFSWIQVSHHVFVFEWISYLAFFTMESGKRFDVQFVTKQEEYSIPDKIIQVPGSSTARNYDSIHPFLKYTCISGLTHHSHFIHLIVRNCI